MQTKLFWVIEQLEQPVIWLQAWHTPLYRAVFVSQALHVGRDEPLTLQLAQSEITEEHRAQVLAEVR